MADPELNGVGPVGKAAMITAAGLFWAAGNAIMAIHHVASAVRAVTGAKQPTDKPRGDGSC